VHWTECRRISLEVFLELEHSGVERNKGRRCSLCLGFAREGMGLKRGSAFMRCEFAFLLYGFVVSGWKFGRSSMILLDSVFDFLRCEPGMWTAPQSCAYHLCRMPESKQAELIGEPRQLVVCGRMKAQKFRVFWDCFPLYRDQLLVRQTGILSRTIGLGQRDIVV
jgi:hypothetical protein